IFFLDGGGDLGQVAGAGDFDFGVAREVDGVVALESVGVVDAGRPVEDEQRRFPILGVERDLFPLEHDPPEVQMSCGAVLGRDADAAAAVRAGVAHDAGARLDRCEIDAHGFSFVDSTRTSMNVRSTLPSMTWPRSTPRNVESRTTTPCSAGCCSPRI